jgi:hypothetical protein
MRYPIMIVALTLALGASAMAQGTSPIKVNSINVAPTSFKAGDSVTVTIQLENTRATSYGCAGMQAAVYAFKAEPYTTTNEVWRATQPVASPMAANEKRIVTFTTKWTVPNVDAPTFSLLAWSPACAPDEFGQSLVLKINKSCVYSYTPSFQRVRLPATATRPLLKQR